MRLTTTRGLRLDVLLLDYVDENWIVLDGDAIRHLRERDVTDARFLDGRLGEIATLPGDWSVVPEAARPIELRDSPPRGPARDGTVTLCAQGPCHDFVTPGGSERHLRFALREGVPTLEVGFAGHDFGHFIDLGKVSPDSVRRTGDRLELPHRTQTWELFAWWADPRPMRLVESVEAQRGHVYLFRTHGRGIDGVLRLHVRELAQDCVTFDWEMLFEYDRHALAARQAIDAELAARVAPRLREHGVRVYNRTRYGDWFKATVHLRHATRDAAHLTHNVWDFQLVESDGYLFLDQVALGDTPSIVDLGPATNFDGTLPPRSTWKPRARMLAQRGHVYAIPDDRGENEGWSAFEVLDIVERDSLVLRWRELRGR